MRSWRGCRGWTGRCFWRRLTTDRATEDIATYDPGNLVFGVLGGGAGAARDCLELIVQAEKHGARVALFGRKICNAESSVLMIRVLRRVIEAGLSRGPCGGGDCGTAGDWGRSGADRRLVEAAPGLRWCGAGF